MHDDSWISPPPVPGPVPAEEGAYAGPPPVLAEVVRSGFAEGRHRGSLVLLGADGGVERAWGDVASQVFPRSANKPFQAAAVLRAGTARTAGELAAGSPVIGGPAGERLALAAASHSGERFHRDLVRKMLAESGLSEDDLRNPPGLPLDPEEREAYLAAGGTRDRVAMNCSGKHAAMLAACVANGWPRESYLSPDHPLQRVVRRTVEETAGEEVRHVGVDGCGAPLMSLSLTALARGFRRLVLAAEDTPERRVADAMRAHPEYVAGTRRWDTWLMRGVPGALAKVGAEGVQAVALPDGRALAFKVDDGALRAVGPVLARALALLDVRSPVLARIGAAPLLGGGEQVGEIRATF